MSLFRAVNVRTPGQVRELAEAFQRAAGGAGGAGAALIAADQEGGQLIALGDGTTPFAGNMALGAADDLELTEAVGRAIGLEARAMGVNVVYAPSLDLATNPANPAIGIRAFGDRPEHVARHWHRVPARAAGGGGRRRGQALPGHRRPERRHASRARPRRGVAIGARRA